MQMSIKTIKQLLVFSFFAGTAVYCWIGPSAEARTSGSGNNFFGRTNAPAFGTTAAETTCTGCHASNPAVNPINAPGGSLTIMAPDTYTPGTDVTITVKINRGELTKFGFQLQALTETGVKAGELATTDTRTQVNTNQPPFPERQYVSHNGLAATAATAPGENSWSFKWTPPASAQGRIVFYAAGNASNAGGTNQGDFIYTTTKAIYPPGFAPTSVTAVSAASYAAVASSESIMALFGANLSGSTIAASTTPLPTSLGGVRVVVHDLTTHIERNAPLFYVSPAQINFLIPSGVTNGMASVTVFRDNTAIASGNITVTATAPALFTYNADGRGVPAAVALRVKGTAQTTENIAQFANNTWEAIPINLGPADEQVFLVAFGTGFRNRMMATATIGGMTADVLAGAQGQFAGLDQANILIPRSLAGRGLVDVVLTVDGKAANTVRINIQ